jgi:nicotinate dehydrogenase subunit B
MPLWYLFACRARHQQGDRVSTDTGSFGLRGIHFPERIEQRIVIEHDGVISARSGKVEYGQGIRTGFAKIVAEVLQVATERVRVTLGETDDVPWDAGTFGSMSTAMDAPRLRAAAAFARALLIGRASDRFGVAAEELGLNGGCVTAPDGRTASYEDLTAGEPLTGIVPQLEQSLEPESAIGRGHRPNSMSGVMAPTRRLEARDIVLGRPRFSADVRLPGMLRGHALHGPTPDAKLLSLDDAVARSMPGVCAVVRDGDFIGVVAEREEQATAAAHALIAEWMQPERPAVEPAELILRRDEGVDAAFACATLTLSASYHVPHIAHAAICPSAAVADVRTDDAHLYVATQRPFGLRDEVAQLLGIAPDRVHVHPRAMGGMFGRGSMNDAAMDAVRLSRAVAHPVLIQWSRADEFRLSPHRPILDAQTRAGLDPSGAILAWHYLSRTNPHTYGSAPSPESVLAMTAGRNALPPYRLPHAEVLLSIAPGEIRTGALRSLAAAPNVFAIESFMDELAHASSQDPIAFRLRHIDDERLKRVIETVRERSGWQTRVRKPDYGFGMACAIYHGTYVAQIAEVCIGSGGRVLLERVWCAVDAGELIWPDGARNQIEGGIQQAASWALLEKLPYRQGKVTAATWHDYSIASCLDAPKDIDVMFTPQCGAKITGVGEPGAVPVAAAIANAIFEASGHRIRELPLTRAASNGNAAHDRGDMRSNV